MVQFRISLFSNIDNWTSQQREYVFIYKKLLIQFFIRNQVLHKSELFFLFKNEFFEEYLNL